MVIKVHSALGVRAFSKPVVEDLVIEAKILALLEDFYQPELITL